MKQCLSVPWRSAFSHCRINLAKRRRNCKGSHLWQLEIVFLSLQQVLPDQCFSCRDCSNYYFWSGAFPGTKLPGKPVASGHFVAPNKQRALKWQLGTRGFPEQTNQLQDTVRWDTVLWPPLNPLQLFQTKGVSACDLVICWTAGHLP